MALMTMPPPLKPEDTIQLLREYKAGDEEAKETVIEGNLRLVVYCAKKFENTGLLIEDLTSIGMIGLLKAIHTFDTEKNIKFATYASRCINNEILMFLRKGKKEKGTINLEDAITTDWDGNELTLMDVTPDPKVKHFSETFVFNDTIEELQEIIMGLPPREQQIIFLRYMANQTQKEVSVALDISQSYISRLEKRVLAKIRKNIERKEEMARAKSKTYGYGDTEKAKDLLATTKLTYKEISEQTGVKLGTVGTYAQKYRPKEVREEMAKKSQAVKKGMQPERKGDTDLAVQLLVEGKLSYGAISARSGVPAGSLTRLRRMYESGNYEWVHEPTKRVEIEVTKPINTSIINEKAFMGDKDIEAAAKRAAVKAEAMVATAKSELKSPTTTIGEAVEEFKQEVRKELKEELRKEILQEMAEESSAEQASKGKINRKVVFSYDGSGTDIPVEDFILEVTDLIENLKASGNKEIEFSLTVKAE